MQQGLAQSMAGGAPAPAQAAPAGGGSEQAALLEKVVSLLMQGADPEELAQKGVPPEVIMQAIEIIEQQMAAEERPSEAEKPQGLAQSLMG